MKKQKVVIFDIDGTAIDSPGQQIPSNRLVTATRSAEQKYYICAATGRVWSFAKPVLQGMELTDPCIISGGTQICDPPTGQIIWQCNIEPDDLQAAVAVFKQYPDYKVLYNDYTREDYLYGGSAPPDLSIDEPVYFIEQVFVPQDIAPEIAAKLKQIKGIACLLPISQRPGFIDVHITNRVATKEHAVAELLQILQVDKRSTIGVGDGHNDIHLFNAVNRRVVVANAVDELKAMADEEIGGVSEDGFATYLERLAADDQI